MIFLFFFPLPPREFSAMNPNCARCGKIVYPTEKVNCLDKVSPAGWHVWGLGQGFGVFPIGSPLHGMAFPLTPVPGGFSIGSRCFGGSPVGFQPPPARGWHFLMDAALPPPYSREYFHVSHSKPAFLRGISTLDLLVVGPQGIWVLPTPISRGDFHVPPAVSRGSLEPPVSRGSPGGGDRDGALCPGGSGSISSSSFLSK